MFQIVAVPFDAYAALPRSEYRWLLTCLSRYVNRAGEAWPSMRQLARDARTSLSSVQRYLAAMDKLGVFQRSRAPGGRYRYTLAEAYRPRWPGRVSRAGHPVPRAETREQADSEKQKRSAHPRARFAKREIHFCEVLDPSDRWAPRIRSWQKSGFWLQDWGPRPNEPGCFAPAALLQA